MKIQSLSVVVPNNKCINSCKFCVSCMHDEANLYKDQMDSNLPFYDLYLKDYIKRLEFCRDNGCNTVMLTGNSEPQQNRKFLTDFGLFMMIMNRPFRNIEMQTTGVLLNTDYLRFLRNHVGVNTISLSISSFMNDENRSIVGIPELITYDLLELCQEIKKYDFNLRLSINLTNSFNCYTPEDIFDIAKSKLGADQITFRILYTKGEDTEQGKWIRENAAGYDLIKDIDKYVTEKGKPIGKLEFGATKYSINGMTTVVDYDCMAQEVKEEFKYLILRPDCKLYSRWDDKASLIF